MVLGLNPWACLSFRKSISKACLKPSLGTDFKSVMPRDERGRWVRLPRTPARQFQARNHLVSAKDKAPDHYSWGLCFGSNGHGMVTNFFRPIFEVPNVRVVLTRCLHHWFLSLTLLVWLLNTRYFSVPFRAKKAGLHPCGYHALDSQST